MALAPDGSIYFLKLAAEVATTAREFFTLPEGTLFQFIPATGALLSVDIPNEEWPIFSGLIVDHRGRLWLGSIGYRELDGTWHLIHPDVEEYFNHAIDFTWITPKPILEDSNEILWFQKFLDSDGLGEGTAWYDPATGEGCLFTTVPTNIVEDSNQHLWMVADENLYTYSLNP